MLEEWIAMKHGRDTSFTSGGVTAFALSMIDASDPPTRSLHSNVALQPTLFIKSRESRETTLNDKLKFHVC